MLLGKSLILIFGIVSFSFPRKIEFYLFIFLGNILLHHTQFFRPELIILINLSRDLEKVKL